MFFCKFIGDLYILCKMSIIIFAEVSLFLISFKTIMVILLKTFLKKQAIWNDLTFLKASSPSLKLSFALHTFSQKFSIQIQAYMCV